MASVRSRVYIPALLALVVAVIGGYAWASRGGEDSDEVVTETTANCPPIARADAAFTLPTEPAVIDILANDSDADGDPLLFDVISVTEGTTGVDDGGTPTNARDDKLIFTPADAALPTATIVYRVQDPTGASSTARVTVLITDAGALPEGVNSAPADEPTDADILAECNTGRASVDTSTTTGLSTSTTEGETVEGDPTATATTLGRSKSTAGRTTGPRSTTTTMRRTTTTSGRSNVSPAPTDPPAPAPTAPRQTTTTRRPNSSTSEPPCDDPQSCRDYGSGFRTTTTPP